MLKAHLPFLTEEHYRARRHLPFLSKVLSSLSCVASERGAERVKNYDENIMEIGNRFPPDCRPRVLLNYISM